MSLPRNPETTLKCPFDHRTVSQSAQCRVHPAITATAASKSRFLRVSSSAIIGEAARTASTNRASPWQSVSLDVVGLTASCEGGA